MLVLILRLVVSFLDLADCFLLRLVELSQELSLHLACFGSFATALSAHTDVETDGAYPDVGVLQFVQPGLLVLLLEAKVAEAPSAGFDLLLCRLLHSLLEEVEL